MQLHHELTAFLSPESTPIHKRQATGIGSTFNNNRSRIPFIIAFAVGLPVVLAIAFGAWWYRRRRRRAYFAGNRQPPARGNKSWGKKKARNVRASATVGGLNGGNDGNVEPPPPVYTGTVANPNANTRANANEGLSDLSPQEGGSSRDMPPSYTDATASEEGRARF